MFPHDRGSIALVSYTGDENAREIKEALDKVIADEDSHENWESLVTKASELEGGVNKHSSPAAIALVRHVYDCFLAKFPLFFGYWHKYADMEFGIGGTETAEMVYERGVAAIPISVDLWTQYCNFKMTTSHDNDVIRDLFERALGFVELDFLAAPLWTKYVEFEERINETARVTKVYERMIHIPMYNGSRSYETFRTLLASRPLDEVTDPKTLQQCTEKITKDPQNAGRSELEIERLVRAELDAHYYQLYCSVNEQVHKRWTFENSIKRPYFHVTDLDDAELVNWRSYLDFEESEGDEKRIMYLYERALVCCALYEEFWLRYARWLYAQGKNEDARIVYMRASCIFVPIAQPTVRLHWARFEEELGYISIARDIHIAMLDQLPEHVETMLSLAGLERRHEGVPAAIQRLEEYINETSPSIGAQLTAEQARLLWQCAGDADGARNVFKERYSRYTASSEFWTAYLNFEIMQPSSDPEEAHTRIKEVYDSMRKHGGFSPTALKDLTKIYTNYLLDRGGKKAAEEYMQLDKELNGARQLLHKPAEGASTASKPRQ
ncbi:hypothetical protein M011DRAFT_465307 [Sporormia fimetaria CBS 119925]|uniref:Uncharacterized protein n=1 Tax=Sporormia fimetaria CBS 119925 TaxID=1340428 RepID=A0A6A6VKH2_9PLEO|nr:hypothetical protein M011DRAFT_465307 [Sporormia fimetaria CBS 119925]